MGGRVFVFETNNGPKTVRADDLFEAKTYFQENWGYWPECDYRIEGEK